FTRERVVLTRLSVVSPHQARSSLGALLVAQAPIPGRQPYENAICVRRSLQEKSNAYDANDDRARSGEVWGWNGKGKQADFCGIGLHACQVENRSRVVPSPST